MTVALQVLLKALINLPKTDFIMLKCVLPQDLVSFTLCVSLYSNLLLCYSKALHDRTFKPLQFQGSYNMEFVYCTAMALLS